MELHTTLTLLIVVASFSRMTSGEDAPGGRRPGGRAAARIRKGPQALVSAAAARAHGVKAIDTKNATCLFFLLTHA